MQNSDPCGVSVVEYARDAGDACAVGCVHCAPAHSLPRRVAGCSHGDVGGGGGDVGGCCYDGGDYGPGGYSESPPRPPPPHLPPRHPSPHAGACVEAFGYNPCSTVLPGHQMFGCAGCGCGAPSGGDDGDGDGGGCAGVSLVQSSGGALPLLFGPLQPSVPVLGLKGAPGLDGSPGKPSSLGQLTSCFSAHSGTKCNINVKHTPKPGPLYLGTCAQLLLGMQLLLKWLNRPHQRQFYNCSTAAATTIYFHS